MPNGFGLPTWPAKSNSSNQRRILNKQERENELTQHFALLCFGVNELRGVVVLLVLRASPVPETGACFLTIYVPACIQEEWKWRGVAETLHSRINVVTFALGRAMGVDPFVAVRLAGYDFLKILFQLAANIPAIA